MDEHDSMSDSDDGWTDGRRRRLEGKERQRRRRRPAVEVSPVRLGRGGPPHSVDIRLEEGNADPRHRQIVRP